MLNTSGDEAALNEPARLKASASIIPELAQKFIKIFSHNHLSRKNLIYCLLMKFMLAEIDMIFSASAPLQLCHCKLIFKSAKSIGI